MIRTVPELRSLSVDVIKIAQNTDPTKTEGKRLLGLITDILDTVDDLVEKQGLSISTEMQQQRTDILNKISNDLSGINDSIASYVSSHMPDLSTYLKSTDSIPYTKLTGTPIIPTYDLSIYQKVADTIPFTRLTGVPNAFDGTWGSLTGKPTFFDGNYNNLINKPVIPAAFSGSYLNLTNKPTIPTYDLSLYRLKSENVDYTQLVNKPKVSSLVWNQLTSLLVSNTTAETNSLVTANGNGTLTIPANTPVGTSFRLSGRGLFSLQTLTSPQLTIKVYLGSVVIAQGTSSSLLLGASNKSFSFGMDIMINATNSVYAQGFFAYYAGLTDALSSTQLVNSSGGLTSSTVDLSIPNDLKLTFTWNIANASNQIGVKIVNFERLNN